MKKTLAGILILALLLCGCQATAGGDTSASGLPSESATLPSIVSPLSSDDPLPTGTVSEAEKPDIFILEPQWDIDFNYNITLAPYLQLLLLTKEPLTEADIDLSLDIQTPYEVQLIDTYPELRSLPVLNADGTVKTAGLFTYDLYLSYRGMGWGDLAEKRAAANEASAEIGALYEAGALPSDSRIQALQPIVDTYNQTYQWALDDYLSLTRDQVPNFHAYQLQIWFRQEPEAEETFTSLSLKIKGMDYSMDVGRVTLKTGLPPEFSEGAYLANETLGVTGDLPECRYNDGTFQRLSFHFTAEADMVLTGLRLSDNAPELQQIRIRQTSVKESDMDFLWDGTSKLRVAEGDDLKISFTLSDARFRTPGTEFRFCQVIEYTVDGEGYTYAVEYVFRHSPNWYELYAEYIDGIDLEPYYTQFYYRTAS